MVLEIVLKAPASKKITHMVTVIDRSEKKLKRIECEAHVVEIQGLQRTNYVFHCIKNPLPHQISHNYFIVDVESGYILAFGATEKAALNNAKNAVSELTTLSDIGTRIISQHKLNKFFS